MVTKGLLFNSQEIEESELKCLILMASVIESSTQVQWVHIPGGLQQCLHCVCVGPWHRNSPAGATNTGSGCKAATTSNCLLFVQA